MRNTTYQWKTASVIKETSDAVTIIFETNGQPFSYKPGQFINVQQVINDEVVSRSYSLSSSADKDEKPAITIKKVDGGVMSNHLFNYAEEISHWEVDGPHGLFYAEPKIAEARPIFLIGGGSGITPLYAIIKTLLKNSDREIFLVDCNRTWNDVLFAQSLNYLEQNFENRLHIHHFLSKELGEDELPCKNYRKEKLSRLVLKKTIKKLLAERVTEADYYLCGPSGLIDLSKEVLEALEVSPSQIYTEHFVPPEEKVKAVEHPTTTQEVLFHFYDQTNLLQVQPGQSILDAALEDKIPLGYSCKNGTCGKCAAKQDGGKVHMANNYALTPDEVENGYVLLCQSHPLNDEVTVIVE